MATRPESTFFAFLSSGAMPLIRVAALTRRDPWFEPPPAPLWPPCSTSPGGVGLARSSSFLSGGSSSVDSRNSRTRRKSSSPRDSGVVSAGARAEPSSLSRCLAMSNALTLAPWKKRR